MKKFFLVLMLLVLAVSMFSCQAAPVVVEPVATPVPVEEEGSKFENVMLKKGTLIVKEFIDCCLFAEDKYYSPNSTDTMFPFTDTLAFQSASILDVETGEKYYALRISTGYYASEYNNGEAIGVMDADEIDGAIQTLKYIKENIGNLKDYSEIVYTASSGMEIGAYHSSKGEKLYVKVNSNATKFYEISEIDSLIAAFEQVLATFGDAQVPATQSADENAAL